MFRRLVDVIKEVFWIKPSREKSKRKGRPVPKRRAASAPKKASPKKAVKKTARVPAVKPAAALKQKATAVKKPAKAAGPDPSLDEVGIITHYFDRIKVCVVHVTKGTVLIGDKLTIWGPKTRYVQKVWSMQIESQDVKIARKGQLIGLKVDKLVAVGDKVYK